MDADEAMRYNRSLDDKFASSGIVDVDDFRRLAEAWVEAGATATQWLEGKLRILRQRVQNGSSVRLFDPRQGREVELVALSEFEEWRETYFPGADLRLNVR